MVMIFEDLNGLRIPKVGLGTWSIGGGSFADHTRDAQGLAALRSAIDLGYTHFDTAEMYGAGHTEELIGQAIRESQANRDSLFIVSKVKPEHLRFESVLKACEGSLRRLHLDYLDLYLIHWPSIGMKLSETFGALNTLVRDGKVRHLGVSNFDLKLLKAAQAVSESPLLTNQVPYSLGDRSYVHNGVLAYCQERGILLTAYSPMNQGHFRPTKALQAVAAAHGVTAHQIALAWLVRQPRVITIPMSLQPAHQRDNLHAMDLKLSESELAQLG